ncbi:hypothetical protein [Sphingomonas sp. KR3-1]|uniref:hypothetical protein n=1 Tax=Sphingomonas sp. KR3-1 TaxID=3156611 RepID=UPI0032B61E65
MSARDQEYFAKRAQQERENAERAEDMTARRVHQEMAERYSARLRDMTMSVPAAAHA